VTDTGYNWGSWTSGGDGVDGGDDVATAGSATSDAISLDGVAACEVGFDLYEDNTGAIAGVVTVYVLGDVDGTNFEETTFSPWSFTVTPIRGDHYYKRFSIDPGSYGGFKVTFANACGQTLRITMNYRTATIPLATA
jgi:hypothetical protein